jgi:hypothetical protein
MIASFNTFKFVDETPMVKRQPSVRAIRPPVKSNVIYFFPVVAKAPGPTLVVFLFTRIIPHDSIFTF